MTQQQNKFILAHQLLDSTVSLAFRAWTEVNETNRTYPNLEAKIHCTCRIKPKTQIVFHGFENWDRIKI